MRLEIRNLGEVTDFWDNIWIWKQFEDFYEKNPNHPCRYIHEKTKNLLGTL